MQRLQRHLLLVVVLGVASIPAPADTIGYSIAVNTSSAVGQGGYIRFDLSPGPIPPILPVTAVVSGYAGGTLVPGDPIADANTVNVTGSLPGMVTMAEPNPITADGLFGIFLGHTFIVTTDGHEVADKFPLELVVAGR